MQSRTLDQLTNELFEVRKKINHWEKTLKAQPKDVRVIRKNLIRNLKKTEIKLEKEIIERQKIIEEQYKMDPQIQVMIERHLRQNAVDQPLNMPLAFESAPLVPLSLYPLPPIASSSSNQHYPKNVLKIRKKIKENEAKFAQSQQRSKSLPTLGGPLPILFPEVSTSSTSSILTERSSTEPKFKLSQ